MTIYLIEALVAVALVVPVVWRAVSWRRAREERQRRLLEESWAIYRASRAIHDRTTETLQQMLESARVRQR